MIEFKNVSKHFGPTQVLHNIDLNIKQGEVVVIIGPSGSGKSTLLRCINKLEEITSGDLFVDGLKVNDPKVDERLIRQEAGMVFQQFYLFPHLTALENVMFGPLRVRGTKKDAAEKQAKELLAKVGLAERSHHYPSELSGGQQQRVAGLYGGNKLPFFITFQGRNLNTPLQVVASGRLHDIIQRSLDPVINTGDQARPEFHRQRNLHRFHRFPRSESGGLLIYLNGGFVSVHLNYLTDQTLAAYTDHVEHVGISHPLCNYQGACHFFNRTFAHWKVTPTFLNL